jgi:hypothetical protein
MLDADSFRSIERCTACGLDRLVAFLVQGPHRIAG